MLSGTVNRALGQHYNFRTYSLEEGMAQSQVLSMCLDKRGNIWFGTFGSGVSIFNGIDFQYLTTRDSLPNNSIWSILEDSKGNMWIGTEAGIAIYDGRNVQVLNTSNGLSDNRIYRLFEDRSGKIYIGTNGGGLIIYDEGKFDYRTSQTGLLSNEINAIFQDDVDRIWIACWGGGVNIIDGAGFRSITEKDGLISDLVTAFAQDDEGNIWIGTHDGISVYDGRSFRNLTTENGLTSNVISSFYHDENGDMWIGTEDAGIDKYNGSTFHNISVENGLSNDHIYDIRADRSGCIWICTAGGGACKYGGETFISYSTVDGLSYNMVMAVHEDLYGNIWLGTDGKALSRFDGKEFEHFGEAQGFTSKYVASFEEDVDGNLWIGTYEDGVFKYDGKEFANYTIEDGLGSNEVYAIFQDSDHNIWIGGDGVTVYNGNKFEEFGRTDMLGIDKISGIVEDKDGNIWIATEHGVARYDGTKVVTLTEEDGLLDDITVTMIRDAKGDVWIGCEGGVSYFDGKGFHNYSMDDGLTSGNVYALVFDKQGNLFVGTEKGIDKITFTWDYDIQRIKNYSASDGFKGVECNSSAAFTDRNNEIWFGTVKGVTVYRPQHDRPNDRLPDIHITGMKLFFEEPDWGIYSTGLSKWYGLPQNLVLPYDQNHVSFGYVGIDFSKPEKVKYQFMLEGFDESWLPVTPLREVTYSNLPPGKYSFKVRASNDLGEWNEDPGSFEFHITPPYWMTWWFYGLTIITMGALVYVVIILRTRQLEKTKQMLELQVAVRTKEILRQKQELETLSIAVSETAEGVLIADKEGNIEWMNDGLKRMTGYGLDEVKTRFGQTIQAVSSHNDIAEVIKNIIKTRESVQYDSPHHRKDGSVMWTTATVTPTFGKSGNLNKIVIIYTDITERKAQEEEISRKNKDITESITYASHIQRAILPERERLYKVKPESFLLWRPRDIVSGDFYWFSVMNNMLVFAAADCTGHGVPGALMSMIGNEYLHQAVANRQITNPDKVLEWMDEKIIESLGQVGEEEESKDGMDIALCTLHLDTHVLQYSGAYRPAFVVRGNEIIEFKPAKFSIGGFYKHKKKFEKQTEQLIEGDVIYLLSDGYTDQFGGERGKKFLLKRFKELIIEVNPLPMLDQKKKLIERFNEWRGDLPQVDDVLVMGVKV